MNWQSDSSMISFSEERKKQINECSKQRYVGVNVETLTSDKAWIYLMLEQENVLCKKYKQTPAHHVWHYYLVTMFELCIEIHFGHTFKWLISSSSYDILQSLQSTSTPSTPPSTTPSTKSAWSFSPDMMCCCCLVSTIWLFFICFKAKLRVFESPAIIT